MGNISFPTATGLTIAASLASAVRFSIAESSGTTAASATAAAFMTTLSFGIAAIIATSICRSRPATRYGLAAFSALGETIVANDAVISKKSRLFTKKFGRAIAARWQTGAYWGY
eukprot:IDg16254t1